MENEELVVIDERNKFPSIASKKYFDENMD